MIRLLLTHVSRTRCVKASLLCAAITGCNLSPNIDLPSAGSGSGNGRDFAADDGDLAIGEPSSPAESPCLSESGGAGGLGGGPSESLPRTDAPTSPCER